ncbi:MAG: hypothetical protein RL226_1577, partial [Bacteroidota bacterium]
MIIGNLDDLQTYLNEHLHSGYYILVDENTHNHCLPGLINFVSFPKNPEIIEVPAGEEAKSIEIAQQLWQSLQDLGADRHSAIINLGGGVVCDLGGFIASTYQRGISYINLPTTVLAMTDAALGGKTAINLGSAKNQIGTFHEPVMTVLSDIWLETLPSRELRSGFAEMLKHGLIAGEPLLSNLFQTDASDAQALFELMRDSANVKLNIVQQDPKETNVRKYLNLGHTSGHALESATMTSEDPLLHGECIAWGMMIALSLSVQKTGLDQELAQELIMAIDGYFPDIEPEFSPDDLWKWMLLDKKNN